MGAMFTKLVNCKQNDWDEHLGVGSGVIRIPDCLQSLYRVQTVLAIVWTVPSNANRIFGTN
jgi:hypothetical protein